MRRAINGKRLTRRRDIMEMILRHQRETLPNQWFDLGKDTFATVVGGRILVMQSAGEAEEPASPKWHQRITNYLKGLFQ